jgi:hypothetical protein
MGETVVIVAKSRDPGDAISAASIYGGWTETLKGSLGAGRIYARRLTQDVFTLDVLQATSSAPSAAPTRLWAVLQVTGCHPNAVCSEGFGDHSPLGGAMIEGIACQGLQSCLRHSD